MRHVIHVLARPAWLPPLVRRSPLAARGAARRMQQFGAVRDVAGGRVAAGVAPWLHVDTEDAVPFFLFVSIGQRPSTQQMNSSRKHDS